MPQSDWPNRTVARGLALVFTRYLVGNTKKMFPISQAKRKDSIIE